MAQTTNFNWYTEGDLQSPTAGTLLADTGPLAAGTHIWQVCVGSTIGFALALEWRDETNAITLKRILLPVAANTEFCMTLQQLTEVDNERLRIAVFTTALGRVQGTIITA